LSPAHGVCHAPDLNRLRRFCLERLQPARQLAVLYEAANVMLTRYKGPGAG